MIHTKTPPDMHQGGLEFLKIVTDISFVRFLSIDKGGDAHHKDGNTNLYGSIPDDIGGGSLLVPEVYAL